MTNHVTLWRFIEQAMSNGKDWTVASLSQYVKDTGLLDSEDEGPCAPTDPRPKWTRNLRNVLQSQRRAGRLVRVSRDLYRLGRAETSAMGNVIPAEPHTSADGSGYSRLLKAQRRLPRKPAAERSRSTASGADMLTRDELRSLIKAFGETCRFVSDLRARCPVAKYVQYPKIPTVLSESLAAHAILNRHLLSSVGPFTSVARGGREADIVAAHANGRRLKIETKASGEEDFAAFGRKDYSADFLLWLRFGSLLREGRLGRIEVLVCPSPGDHLSWWAEYRAGAKLKDRVTVAELTSAWDGQLVRVQVDLVALLSEAN
jgi:hypothetical protein